MDNELTNKINLIGTEKQIKYAIDIIEGAISMGQRFKLKPLQEKYERVKNRGTEKYTAEKNAKTLAKIQKHIDAVNAGLNFLRNTLTSGYHAKNIIENQDRLFSQDIQSGMMLNQRQSWMRKFEWVSFENIYYLSRR